jgi:transcriptional regulator with PAS, ATPase and Fis domain
VGIIEFSCLSEKIVERSAMFRTELNVRGTLKEMVEALEKSVLSQLLEKHGGNRTRAAKELGLSRYGLMKKMQRYGF